MTPLTSALERAPLAACPFCGDDDPELHHDGSASNFLQGGCRNPDCVLFDCFPGAYRDHDHFAEWWNRRPLEDALARRAEAAEKALRNIVEHFGNRVDAPGHCHDKPGIWDADNAPGIAGTPCEWCAQWTAARALITPIAEGR